MLRKLLRSVRLLALASSLLAACGADSTGPEPVPGTYVATTLTVTDNGETINALDRGVSIQLTLRANGTTTGVFHFPAGYESGEPAENIALDGTWSRNGNIITFDQPGADTFLRDAEFRVRGNRLESTFRTTRVVLTRQ